MNTQTKVGVGVRLRLGLRFIITKKKGDVNMNMIPSRKSFITLEYDRIGLPIDNKIK